MGAEAARFHMQPLFFEHGLHGLQQRLGLLGSGGGDEAGAPSVARVAQQRELGDEQDLAAHVQHGAVHLVLVVHEHAQSGQFVRAQARVGLGVAHFGADQHHVALANFARNFSIHGHAGARDPLHYQTHILTSPPGTLR